MLGETIQYGLLAGLAIALLIAAFTDLRSRTIYNWLNGGIALAAPAFWWASGLELWPDVAMQIGVTLAVFAALCGLFAIGWMGGGDVKLLTALALWIPPLNYFNLLIVMALVGGVLTIVMGAWHVARRQKERLQIPYGVAIAAAGLWVLGTHYLPQAEISGLAFAGNFAGIATG